MKKATCFGFLFFFTTFIYVSHSYASNLYLQNVEKIIQSKILPKICFKGESNLETFKTRFSFSQPGEYEKFREKLTEAEIETGTKALENGQIKEVDACLENLKAKTISNRAIQILEEKLAPAKKVFEEKQKSLQAKAE